MDEQKKLEDKIKSEMAQVAGGDAVKGGPAAPTAPTATKNTTDIEMVDEQTTNASQSLLMLSPTNYESMLQLGRMALNDYEKYERLFDIPKYMQYERVQANVRSGAKGYDNSKKFDHLIL